MMHSGPYREEKYTRMPPVMEHIIKHDSVECSRVIAVGSKYPKHTHEEYVISANLAGHERIWLNGQYQDVAPHQLTLYNPLTVQASEFSPNGAEFVSIHLDAGTLRSVLGENNLPVFQEGVVRDQGVFNSIVGLYQRSQPEQQEDALLGFISELMRLETTPSSATEPLHVSQLIAYMKDNLYEEVSLDDLCAETRLSKFHLVRSFKASKHLPPIQYFNQLRLIEARKRLRDGDRPAQVAADLGFFDQGHLSNAFRKVMGVSPQHYTSMIDNG